MNSCLLTLSVSVLVDRFLKLSPNLFERLAHLISIRRITMRAGRADETLAKHLIVLDTDRASTIPVDNVEEFAHSPAGCGVRNQDQADNRHAKLTMLIHRRVVETGRAYGCYPDAILGP